MFSLILALVVIYLLVQQQNLIEEVRRYNQNHPSRLPQQTNVVIEAEEVIPPESR